MQRFTRHVLVALAFVLFAVVLPPVCHAGKYLVAIGGGERPAEAIKAFVSRSGGSRAKILVITWASNVPDESFAAIMRDLDGFGATAVAAPRAARCRKPCSVYQYACRCDQSFLLRRRPESNYGHFGRSGAACVSLRKILVRDADKRGSGCNARSNDDWRSRFEAARWQTRRN